MPLKQSATDEESIKNHMHTDARDNLFPRATSQVAACRHLATAARVKYPAALQRCKFDTPLLAAGSLIAAQYAFDQYLYDFRRKRVW